MRHLILTMGAPGAGKSSWIRSQGLEPFTLSPDNIRMMVQNPVLNTEGSTEITMANDGLVWKTLFQLLESRMQRGDFTVIDATHSKTSMITQYKELCMKYRYRCTVVDFSGLSVDTILAQNKQRPTHKHVPEDAILNIIERLKAEKTNPGWTNKVLPEEFEEAIYFKPMDMSHYKKIHHIGDIHGCYDVLHTYFAEGLKEDELYIFTGDYIDRGPQNAETMKFLMNLIKNHKNVIFLEGNHERWLWAWANEEGEEAIRSRVFRNETQPQLEQANIDKSEARQFYRRLRQAVYYTYGDKTVFVTHGGFPLIPEKLEHISTHAMINGVGKYEDDIDAVWTEKTEENFYQVHGHRNIYRLPTEASPRSFNVEGQVEGGGHLRVAILDENGWTTKEIKNDNFIVRKSTRPVKIEESSLTPELLLEYLSNHKSIRRTQLTDHIASFNFTKEAFWDKKWDDINVKARGLFVNTDTGEIVSRSYNKFFNVGERSFTKISALADDLQFPVRVYTKPNGYLGIVGYDSKEDELVISSKSETRTDFAGWFKELFYKTFDESAVAWIKNFLKSQGVSMTFEVILTEKDPHIIKYEADKIVMLDIVYRDIVYKKMPFEIVQDTARFLGIEHKELRHEFDKWLDFYAWYKDVSKDYSIEEEGYVIEDASGFMTKLKLPYYNFWKNMRGIRDGIIRRHNTPVLYSAKHNKVYNWMVKQGADNLRKMSIIDIRDAFEAQEKEVQV